MSYFKLDNSAKVLFITLCAVFIMLDHYVLFPATMDLRADLLKQFNDAPMVIRWGFLIFRLFTFAVLGAVSFEVAKTQNEIDKEGL